MIELILPSIHNIEYNHYGFACGVPVEFHNNDYTGEIDFTRSYPNISAISDITILLLNLSYEVKFYYNTIIFSFNNIKKYDMCLYELNTSINSEINDLNITIKLCWTMFNNAIYLE